VALKEAIAGAAAGALAKTAVAPIERVKLLMQLGRELSSNNSYSNDSAWQVARNVYKEQGMLAFWRGMFQLYKYACPSFFIRSFL
jgi:hypothetical protein